MIPENSETYLGIDLSTQKVKKTIAIIFIFKLNALKFNFYFVNELAEEDSNS